MALAAWAESDRPQCPPEHLGACFVGATGAYSGVLLDAEGDRITTSGIDTAEGNDRFLRILPDGTEVLHVAKGDVMMVFCPAGAPSSDYCFTGAGRVSAMATGRGAGCPTTVHMQGTGSDAFGNEQQFTEEYVKLT